MIGKSSLMHYQLKVELDMRDRDLIVLYYLCQEMHVQQQQKHHAERCSARKKIVFEI